MSNLLHFAITFLMLMTLVTSSGNAKLVNVMENDRARINFTHSCNVYEVVLQAGYKPPFYHSRHGGILNLPPDQADRFFVENSNYTNGCSLNLTILNVHKDDATTYTCSIYKDRESVEDYKRVGLHVDYPPGKASCKLKDKQDGDWSSVQCNASVGSLPGHIACYQNGERMPSLNDPFESNTSLMQVILIKNSHFVFCCSSSLKETKKPCECSDSIIDPIYNRHLPSRDVCLATTPSKVTDKSTSQKAITSKNLVSTVTKAEFETAGNSTKYYSHKIIVIFGSVVALFFLIILIMVILICRQYYDTYCHFCQRIHVGKQGNGSDERMEQLEMGNIGSRDPDRTGDDQAANPMISARKYETTSEESSLQHDD